MHSYTMQDWVEIAGQPSISSITQSASSWFDMSMFHDVIVWLQVNDRQLGGGTATAVSIVYETAPIREEGLFFPMTPLIVLTPGLVSIATLFKTVGVPLSRWLRWQLFVSGAPASAWSAVFRVLLSANASACTRPLVTSPAPSPSATPPTTLALEPSSVPLHLTAEPRAVVTPPPSCGCSD